MSVHWGVFNTTPQRKLSTRDSRLACFNDRHCFHIGAAVGRVTSPSLSAESPPSLQLEETAYPPSRSARSPCLLATGRASCSLALSGLVPRAG